MLKKFTTRRNVILGGFALYTLTASAWEARSQSLFPVQEANRQFHSSSGVGSLFSDVKASGVGDILNITIQESTTAQSTATTKTANDDTVSAFGGTGLFARFFKDLALTANNSNASNGTGQTSRSGSLFTTLSVTVKEVLPNGVLKIEGSRTITINREAQKVSFTGLIRREDITSENTIASSLVAGVEVHYDGRGIVGGTQRRGLLSTIFHFLF